MVDDRCTIIIGTERFNFTRDQLESDPGNYFATYFFGEVAEASHGARELVIEKDARLFRLIQAHLRGYEIFPLPDSAIPHYMTKEVAIKNLRHDAQLYCLKRLEEKTKIFELISLNKETGKRQDSPVAKRYKYGTLKVGHPTWSFQDINSDGYHLILNTLKNRDTTRLFVPLPYPEPWVPGFSVTFCWQEITLNEFYVLLVSNDPKEKTRNAAAGHSNSSPQSNWTLSSFFYFAVWIFIFPIIFHALLAPR
ncbi:hypothetical protein M408DRAFT_332236 [Serendipita vermifera MAFF 305830]|uniref:BTB domain-containing protein n=1 Tax=Serendipita vermifera MAFF 305830 TaxID=933852 RepID=A0A0C3AWL6_SERVB|nr:hypothetical protein M408DRAFT_332236 [Serendipita vermifera MAFF 305830]